MSNRTRRRINLTQVLGLIGLLVLLIGGYLGYRGLHSQEGLTVGYFKSRDGKASQPLYFELASSPAETEKGLMFRDSLPPNQGMLFQFAEEKERTFWMKNTRIPLDIIFLNKDYQVVSIHPNARVLSLEPISSTEPSKYVVELIAGAAQREGIAIGTRLEIDHN